MDNKLLQPGTMLRGGAYRVERSLSSGGFGNTYVVTNVNFDETYALKEFFMKEINLRDGETVTVSVPDNKATFDSQRSKFMKEAQRLRRLKNNHIVGVHDLFEENGTTYYVMDFIDGESLSSRIKRTGQPLTEEEASNVLSQVLDALDAVHQQHIWHLDLKPANIMMDKTGKALLIDFGASKQMSGGEGLTTTSGLCYTPGYAPIEQIEQSLDKFGPWTDLYSLGATLYHLLTLNSLPSPMELVEEGAEALQFPPTVSPKMRQLICYMMQPNRKNRPQSVAEVRAMLGEKLAPQASTPPKVPVSEETIVLGSPKKEDETQVVAKPTPKPEPKPALRTTPKPNPSAYQPAPKSTPKWPFVLGAAAVLLLLLVGGGLFLGSKLLKGTDDPSPVATATITGPAETTETSEPTGPAEPSETTETSEPTETTKPAETTKPTELTETTKPQPAQETQPAQPQPTETTKVVEADNNVYDVVEQMPSFPGLQNWLASHINYPAVAEENGIQGRVIVSFIVEKNGSVSSVQVVKSVDPSLDREALRVVNSMPRWTPGRQNGQPVRVKYTLPVSFRL